MTIKEARIKTKRSPEEVAKLLGFPLKTWLAWEEEEKKPPKYIEKLILEEDKLKNKVIEEFVKIFNETWRDIKSEAD